MQSDDREGASESRRDPGQPPDWSTDDFDDFEAFEGSQDDDDAGDAQRPLDFGSSGPESSDDAPPPAEIGVFDDTFESGFDAEAGTAEEAEADEAVEVPEFASFTVGEPEDEGLSAFEVVTSGEPRDREVEVEADAGSPAPVAEISPPAGAPMAPRATGELSEPDEEGEAAADEETFGEFTSEQYLQTTTQEFVDLAEEIARAGETEHVPSAVAAAMPGLESGVVGLDDVVAASGHDPSVIEARRGSDLSLRILTGAGLAVIFFASLYSELLVGLFMFLVLMAAAVEFFSTLMRRGYRPVGLFGLLGAAGALLGTWVWGPRAIPVALIATLVVTLVFFAAAGGSRGRQLNVALTVLGAAWIGGLGGFVFDMIDSPHYGWLIVATIVTVALMDVAQYTFGRRLGRIKLAPRISPNKTVEGLVGGVLVAVLVGLVFGLLQDPVLFLDLESPIDLGAGLALGLVVAGAAPFGDLAVSAVKRSLGVKDMGSVLPGHGGLLDRIDAMLFAIPLTWIVFAWTGLLA